jgi:UDP-glucose-4-epimerase GalE
MSRPSVLVTGGAGFIGSNTAHLLAANGWQVTVFDNLSTGHRTLADGLDLVTGDLLHPADLDALFTARRFDAVVHFAALSLVGQSVTEPLRYYENNVAGSRNLLDAMLRHGTTRLVFSSTAATYGEPVTTPITEDHPQQPINPYGRTKLAVEWMLRDADLAHGLRFVALRYFNAAGADPDARFGEWHNPESHLIPILLRCAAGLTGPVKVLGTDYPTPDGTCVRDYIHVHDLARAHALALRHLLDGGPSAALNLGCSRGTSVRTMLDLARRVTGAPIPSTDEPRRPGDPATLVASSARARALLGWTPALEDPEIMLRHAWAFFQRRGFAPKD